MWSTPYDFSEALGSSVDADKRGPLGIAAGSRDRCPPDSNEPGSWCPPKARGNVWRCGNCPFLTRMMLKLFSVFHSDICNNNLGVIFSPTLKGRFCTFKNVFIHVKRILSTHYLLNTLHSTWSLPSNSARCHVNLVMRITSAQSLCT